MNFYSISCHVTEVLLQLKFYFDHSLVTLCLLLDESLWRCRETEEYLGHRVIKNNLLSHQGQGGSSSKLSLYTRCLWNFTVPHNTLEE